MSSIEELKHKLELKVKELDDYIETHKDYLSDEAESIRKEIYELQDKIKLFERASDENVAKDIEFLKNNEADALYFRGNPRLKNAIQNILAELKKKDRRIQELEEENELILNSKIGVDLSYDDYVPKQKIKDKIEEIKEDRESKYYDNFLEERDIEKTVQVLQELLQESEDK